MKSVTAVVVTHNSKDSIERPLQSVVDSTIADQIELVLVDNASADGTADLVRQRFPGCRVIDAGENLGFGRACNLGARESESEHILLLNPDAWVDAACVERLRGSDGRRPAAGLGGATSLLPRRRQAVQLDADGRDLR